MKRIYNETALTCPSCGMVARNITAARMHHRRSVKEGCTRKVVLQTLGKISVVKAKDSGSFKDRVIGFVAQLPGGSEYYGKTQNQAVAFCIEKVGDYAF